MKPSEAFRIGCGAGFSGDRIEPARALAEQGGLNALVFECLAERTMALAELRRQADPALGYDPLLAERLEAVLPACRARQVRVITNMGAANPPAAAQLALQRARALGLSGLRIAAVSGDDVLAWLRAHDVPLIDAPDAAHTSVHSLGDQLLSAHAYLGADALLPALQAGADLVIAGRVADPALFLAPLQAHFGWACDDWPVLGRGIAVGHLLECGAQVSGGYLADPGFCEVPELADVGFPMADVWADGSARIHKLPGSGGRIDRLSCSAQLLYEIEDPSAYLQPDVTADFSGVHFAPSPLGGMDVHGASGRAAPAQLKVCLGLREGFMADGQISYAGAGARGRAELAREVLRKRLARLGLAEGDLRLDLLGLDGMHGPASRPTGSGREPAELRLRCAVRALTRAHAEQALREVDALYLNGPAGGGGVTLTLREVLGVRSALVPREALSLRTEWLEA